MKDYEEDVTVVASMELYHGDEESGSGSTELSGDPLLIEETEENPDEVDVVVVKKKRNFVWALGLFVCLLLLVFVVIVPAVVVTKNKKNKAVDDVQNNSNETTTEPPPPQEAESVEPVEPEDENQPFALEIPEDARIPTFSADVLNGYSSRKEFEEDLIRVAKHMVYQIINFNIYHQDQQYNQYQDQQYNQNQDQQYNQYQEGEQLAEDITEANGDDAAVPDTVPVSSEEEAVAREEVPAVQERSGGDEDEETKVKQEEKKKKEEEDKEADFIVRDDNYVYAAYGDYVLVWDHQGNSVEHLKMPSPEGEEPGRHRGWQPKAHINALFLTQDHLIVLASHYGGHYCRRRRHLSEPRPMMYIDPCGGRPYLSGDNTEVRVYAKPQNNEMPLVRSKNMRGSYSNAVLMPNSLQVITSSWLDVHFDGLDVHHFPWATKEQYVEKAMGMASKNLIPKFVEEISEAIFGDQEDDVKNMMRINTWGADEDTAPTGRSYGRDIMEAYNEITLMDISSLTTQEDNEESIKTSVSSFFGPNVERVETSDSSLVLSMRSSRWDDATGRSNDSLFLVSMMQSLEEDDPLKMEFHSLAKLEGRLSVHSPGSALDIRGSDLRVVRTIRRWDHFGNVWANCGDIYYQEDMCLDGSNWIQCSTVAWGCPGTLVKSGGCPYTEFTCETDPDEPTSSTENFVTVLDLSPQGEMVEHGTLQVGNDHEAVTSVYFDESAGYVTTFDHTIGLVPGMFPELMNEQEMGEMPELPMRKESFYVLDLDVAQGPSLRTHVVLEQGARSSLRPLEIDDDKTLLIGMGQNTTTTSPDERHRPRSSWGLITVFDVSDPDAPQVVADRILANEAGFETHSDAEWDAKAATLYKDGGILVIPVQMYRSYYPSDDFHNEEVEHLEEELFVNHTGTPPPSFPVAASSSSSEYDDFQGFIVFDVSNVPEKGIVELLRINHRGRGETCHYCDGYFHGSRSYVFDESDGSRVLVTASGEYVVGTDVDTGKELWSFSPSDMIEGENKDCCW